MRSVGLLSLACSLATAAAVGRPAAAGSGGSAGSAPSSAPAMMDPLQLQTLLPRLNEDKFAAMLQDDQNLHIVTVLDSPDTCGEMCGNAMQMLARLQEKSGPSGLFKLSHILARDVLEDETGEPAEVHKMFNLTAIPHMLVYPPGPKLSPQHCLKIPPETAGHLLQAGPKAMYNTFSSFLPNMVSSAKSGGWSNFLSKPAGHLPRLLLVSDKRETPALLKKLALEFASRLVVGQAHIEDKKLAAAFNLTAPSAPSSAAKKGKEGAAPVTPAVKLPALFLSKAVGKELVKQGAAEGKAMKQGAQLSFWQRLETAGGMSLESVRELLTQHYSSVVPVAPALLLAEQLQQGGMEEEEQEQAAAAAAAAMFAPLPRLSSPANFTEHCSAAGDVTMCFLALLPEAAVRPVLPAEGAGQEQQKAKKAGKGRRRSSSSWDDDDDEAGAAGGGAGAGSAGGRGPLAVLTRVASRSFISADLASLSSPSFSAQRMPLGFSYLNGEAQAEFAAAFGSPALPAFLALNPRKKVFALMKGSFSDKNLREFVLAVMEQTTSLAGPAAASSSSKKAAELATIQKLGSLPELLQEPAEPELQLEQQQKKKKLKAKKAGSSSKKQAAAPAGGKGKGKGKAKEEADAAGASKKGSKAGPAGAAAAAEVKTEL